MVYPEHGDTRTASYLHRPQNSNPGQPRPENVFAIDGVPATPALVFLLRALSRVISTLARFPALLNLAIFLWLVNRFDVFAALPVLPLAVASVIAMVFNFFASKYLAFRIARA